ncbi:MAG TPA: TetR family transcriptional regulator [Mycobacterium sp.]|jgi:Bacterial regulatory proteins, tetR family|nr:TetR family transcriptional regulator [Mycobacterium sp.]HXB85418.1 TetR family transcriptional regulator [Mycobacterium sp.]
MPSHHRCRLGGGTRLPHCGGLGTMVPKARSETTRQKFLDAAIDLFSEVGYAAAGLGEIIERAGMTKGATAQPPVPGAACWTR